MTVDLGYGSHFPMVALAVQETDCAVLELGAGWWSTPMLHELCRASGRYLLTVETKPDWLALFEQFRSPEHELLLVSEDDAGLDRVPIEGRLWGCAFVDHAPGTRRVRDIERLRKHAALIVVHDTEEKGYGYEPLLSSFKHRRDYGVFHPRTTIVSDMRPIP